MSNYLLLAKPSKIKGNPTNIGFGGHCYSVFLVNYLEVVEKEKTNTENSSFYY